jgi:hypothetical protein
MPSLESEVVKTFLDRLEAADEVNEAIVERLRLFLSANKLPNAEQLAELFATGSGDRLA